MKRIIYNIDVDRNKMTTMEPRLFRGGRKSDDIKKDVDVEVDKKMTSQLDQRIGR